MRLLAGDVGGTNTRLALYEDDQQIALSSYKNAEQSGLEAIIDGFLADHPGASPAAACVGVAGPVRRGRVRLTNIDWQLDHDQLSARLGYPVQLVNDFQAQAAAVPHLDLEADTLDLGPAPEGTPDLGAPIAVLGPGTGLGEALLIPDAAGHRVLPTEGGHARFAPRDEREVGLLRSLWQIWPEHVSVERVLSGPGLVAIYDHLRGDAPRRPEMATTDPAAVISAQALAGGCPICVEAMEIFIGVLGDEAANLALKSNAGRVFIAGGIGPRIAPLLQGRLRQAFTAKGRFSSWLRGVPTRLITRSDTGLLGAWAEARRLKEFQ